MYFGADGGMHLSAAGAKVVKPPSLWKTRETSINAAEFSEK
jgi:hypothetical protein